MVLGALLLAVPAAAHQDTVAHSRMVIRPNGDVAYALKIPVEDLAEVLGQKGHHALQAPEVRVAEERLFQHFQALVSMTSRGAPCPAERDGIDVPEDERLYAELRFVFHCTPRVPVTIDYRVFFEEDPRHVGLLEVESAGGVTRAELIAEHPRWEVDASREGAPALRPVEGTPELPTEKSRPSANTLSTGLAKHNGKIHSAGKSEASQASSAQAPPHPRATEGGWKFIAVLVAAGGGFIALRATRRSTST